MSRLGTRSRAGFRQVMDLPLAHGGLSGVVWALAPLDWSALGELCHHGRPAARRECVWALMSDGWVWYVGLDVESGEILTAHRTQQACPAARGEAGRVERPRSVA